MLLFILFFYFAITSPYYMEPLGSLYCSQWQVQAQAKSYTPDIPFQFQPVTNIKTLVQAIKYPKYRLKAIEELMALDESNLKALGPGDLKLLLAGAIELNSETTLRTILWKINHTISMSTSYWAIAMQLASRKRNVSLASCLLSEARRHRTEVDIDLLNKVMDIYIYHNRIHDVLDLIAEIQSGGYGEDVRCTSASFELLSKACSRLPLNGNNTFLVRICRIVSSLDDEEAFALHLPETILLKSLHMCALTDDIQSALEILTTFAASNNSSSGTDLSRSFVEKCYMITLSCFLASLRTPFWLQLSSQTLIELIDERMDTLVLLPLLTRGLDKDNIQLTDLVFRYLLVRDSNALRHYLVQLSTRVTKLSTLSMIEMQYFLSRHPKFTESRQLFERILFKQHAYPLGYQAFQSSPVLSPTTSLDAFSEEECALLSAKRIQSTVAPCVLSNAISHKIRRSRSWRNKEGEHPAG
jgi:hypothetical protein